MRRRVSLGSLYIRFGRRRRFYLCRETTRHAQANLHVFSTGPLGIMVIASSTVQDVRFESPLDVARSKAAEGVRKLQKALLPG